MHKLYNARFFYIFEPCIECTNARIGNINYKYTNMNIKNFATSGVRDQLPHGAIVQIAKRAGVLTQTVSRALKGDTRSPKLPEIIKATAEYLKEYKAKENEANQALDEALNSETSEQFSARMNNQREKYGEETSPIL